MDDSGAKAEIDRRLTFIAASDLLKLIERANTLSSDSRFENVAEHSWHVSLLAMIFADAAPDGTDHNRVRDLLVVHDLVEVHAGDTVVWDNRPESEVRLREVAAANRLFGMLSQSQNRKLLDLWQEFDALETVEARFARALDAIHPMLMSWGPGSNGHPRTDLRPARVLQRKRGWLVEFPMLWQIAQDVVQSAVDRGLLDADECEQGNIR
ncbi:MAG: HD domain-containing protein [Thermomicrobiales bacterium]